MNVLITGGTGFIGSRLAIKCLEKGNKVRILGQQNTPAEKENFKLIKAAGAEVLVGSVTDYDIIADCVAEIDVVYHLAAAQHEANVPDQVFWDVNVTGTKNILDACISSGVKKFVHGCTIGVYGSHEGAIDELSPCNPDNIYGKTKLEGEKLALSYKDRIPLVVIRISETYGPGDRRLLKLYRAIYKKAFFKIGPGKNLHQLIYIDDLVDGMLRAAESQRAEGEVILLVGSKPITTDEMVDTIASELNVKLPPFRAPLFPFTATAVILESILRPVGIQPPLHRRRMDFFKKSFSFSTTRAEDLLGFTPQYTFAQGVAKTALWYSESGMLAGGKDGTGHHTLPAEMKVDPDLAAQIEPFDTFWEAPADVEKGFGKFAKFYRRNYFKHMPTDKSIRSLVISCGAGYMVELMQAQGYSIVLGIDSDPEKITVAERHGLNCRVANAFPFLRDNSEPFDLIFAEQEINHLTKAEILAFLELCSQNLNDGGLLFVHSLNGANPITGPEALAQNFNHFNTFTEYSLRQILGYSGFRDIRVFPLKLYIFYENPVNYVGMVLDGLLNLLFRAGFIFYGKDNKIFSKKIAAVCVKNDLNNNHSKNKSAVYMSTLKEIDEGQLIREKLSRAETSPIKTYMDLTVGQVGFARFLLYEFLTSVLGPIPGGVGFFLRRKFYPPLFRRVGHGLIIGRNVVIRHPDKIEIGDNVTIDDYCLIDGRGAGEEGIVFEDNVIINRNCMIQSKAGPIRLGKRSSVGCNSVIVSMDGVEFGESVMTAGGCYISAGSYHYDNVDQAIMDQGVYAQGPIKIGAQTWLGTAAMVLDGVTIGTGAVIGSGAVVMKDIPDYGIAAGRPPVLLGTRKHLSE